MLRVTGQRAVTLIKTSFLYPKLENKLQKCQEEEQGKELTLLASEAYYRRPKLYAWISSSSVDRYTPHGLVIVSMGGWRQQTMS